MAPRPLLVLDGDSLAHRAYHGSRPLAGAGGRPINAMHGFAIMAIGLWRAEKPRAVLACWDTLTAPTYRHELWPSYQAGREFDPEILEQLDRMPELCEALGFAWAKGAGYEADDFLATAARLETEAGGRALVVTSDRDAYQLVSDSVAVLAPRTGGYAPDRIDGKEVVERYKVLPEQVPDFIALRGDPSDKIPGAKGIGAKGAADLLLRYGTLEGIVEAADELSLRQAEAVRDERLALFRRVATMDRRAPVKRPRDNTLDQARAAAYAREIGDERLAERIAGRG
ncbi:MAG TPA: 5'-3' exonuclease [Gaiellales bacterium]|nr:5'-3' exonuclease [Gaiellales bacterium]